MSRRPGWPFRPQVDGQHHVADRSAGKRRPPSPRRRPSEPACTHPSSISLPMMSETVLAVVGQSAPGGPAQAGADGWHATECRVDRRAVFAGATARRRVGCRLCACYSLHVRRLSPFGLLKSRVPNVLFAICLRPRLPVRRATAVPSNKYIRRGGVELRS